MKKILVADDEEMVCLLKSEKLGLNDCEVVFQIMT